MTQVSVTPLEVFLSVARGKVSAPQALHSGIHCSVAPGSLLLLPCPALPRCPPCSVPGNVLRPMPHPSSGFRSLRRRDVRGMELAGNLKIVKV
ncbi:unnamed protein product, partial [Staurois parvus]